MFLTEKELKERFWQYYNYNHRAIRYEFESPIREGCADLITVESYQDNIQFNAFEFKLQDIRKALLQAKANSDYVHKSWIVVPIEKKTLILERYHSYLQELKYIGVIAVEAGGKWEMIYKPVFRTDIKLHNHILKLMLNKI